MPHHSITSAKHTNKNTNSGQLAEAILLQLFCQTEDSKQMQRLFSALFTEKECSELANRIQIFALLQQGLPQREIAERLGVGIATVSRGAKAYQVNDVANLLPNLKEKF